MSSFFDEISETLKNSFVVNDNALHAQHLFTQKKNKLYADDLLSGKLLLHTNNNEYYIATLRNIRQLSTHNGSHNINNRDIHILCLLPLFVLIYYCLCLF